jgi:hypothetical protein
LKYGALQYVILSPIIAALTIMLAGISAPGVPAGSSDEDSSLLNVNGTFTGTLCYDCYCDGNFRYDRGYAYITFLQNMTQLLSLYTLGMLTPTLLLYLLHIYFGVIKLVVWCLYSMVIYFNETRIKAI